MKRSPFFRTNAVVLILTVLALFLAAASRTLASSSGGDHIDVALASSKAWVEQIDAGKYEDTYNASSQAMQTRVPQDRWLVVLKALRTPWGPVVSRKELSHVYKPNGYEGDEGEFMVITYDTAFQKLSNATEVVVLKWENGKWLGAGYNAGATATADDSTPVAPISTTETHTEEHVHPPPPQPQ